MENAVLPADSPVLARETVIITGTSGRTNKPLATAEAMGDKIKLGEFFWVRNKKKPHAGFTSSSEKRKRRSET